MPRNVEVGAETTPHFYVKKGGGLLVVTPFMPSFCHGVNAEVDVYFNHNSLMPFRRAIESILFTIFEV